MLPQATAIDELARRAASQRLEVRAGFHPEVDEFSAVLPAGTIAGSVVLLGFTGSCIEKACLSSCPVGAFSSAGYALDTCLDHVLSAAGIDCREHGCHARRACPVGAEHSYVDEQARFHMAAFLRSVRDEGSDR